MLPRQGHFKQIKKISSYIKIFPKGRIIVDTSYPAHCVYPVEYHSNRLEFYPDSGEEFPKDLPLEKGPIFRITVYIVSDHAHDLVTRRSITRILVMINNT
jgi:hypothetical protein